MAVSRARRSSTRTRPELVFATEMTVKGPVRQARLGQHFPYSGLDDALATDQPEGGFDEPRYLVSVMDLSRRHGSSCCRPT